MDSLKLALEKIVNGFIKSASLYVAILVIFSYHVLFEKDLACTCKEQTTDCWLYISLPGFLILFLLLWIDKSFQRVWRYTVSKCSLRLWYLFFYRIFAAFFIGLLWPLSVLLDGEWYVCCFPDQQQPQLACKNKTSLTDKEEERIDELKNKSRNIGLPVLLIITFLAAIISSIPWRKCLSCCTTSNNSEDSKNDVRFDEIILEQAEFLVVEELRKSAKEKITAKLNTYREKEEWRKCFDVAEEFITETITSAGQSPAPALPPAEESNENAGLLS